MVKSILSVSIDSEILEQLKLKYPREISKFANEYFRDLLEIDNKNNENKDKDIEQLEEEIEDDEHKEERLINDLKDFRINLRLKREALIFARTEKKKKDAEELQLKINMADSILASGILAERAGRSKRERDDLKK